MVAPNRYDVPLVADIHFQPAVAMMVADAFEKIRVNPGNFADGRKTFEVINYDDPAQFAAEQEQIREVRMAAPSSWCGAPHCLQAAAWGLPEGHVISGLRDRVPWWSSACHHKRPSSMRAKRRVAAGSHCKF